ncbi:hypothetical protein ACJQ40_002268 [Enterococcus faecium]|uniref:hypothetical protein n=1 Tax=Enterococcus TaxID=1350 RepID=UPI0005EBECB5|nr:hypothetical protein [Enterococcus faecium]EME7165568.1 hypothetical protein [Enterococcus faecium]KNB93741.1 hypothetical protein LK34_05735 [Enterococcus faecium]
MITITDGHMSHTVKTKEEAQHIIDRYFSEEESTMQIRKPFIKQSSRKLFLATIAKDKEPIYKVRQLQALCYISLVLNVILLSVVFAIL